MSCTLGLLTDSRISFAEKSIIERMYCAPHVCYYNFVQNYLFRFKESLAAVLIILVTSIFLYFRLNKIVFKRLFINQLMDFLETKHLIETEIAAYFFSLPILVIFVITGSFEFQSKRPMNNLIFSTSIIGLGLPLLLSIIILSKRKALKVMRYTTAFSLWTIIGFVVIITAGLIKKVLTYYTVAAVLLLAIVYTIGFLILGKRDKAYEMMTQNGYDTTKVERVHFYPEEINDGQSYLAKRKNSIDPKTPVQSKFTATRLDLGETDRNADVENEMMKVSVLMAQNIEKQQLKAKMIEELEEELKEEDPWWVVIRQQYLPDEDMSTYALDNLISYLFVTLLVLTVPSNQNPLVLKGLKVIPLTLGAIAFIFNLSMEFNLVVVVLAIIFVILYYSFKTCTSETTTLWVDNMIFFLFIWCFIFNVVRLFFDFTLFIRFYYDFKDSEAVAINGIVFITPLVYLNVALQKKGRSVLAFMVTLSVLIKLCLVNFVYDGFFSLKDNAKTFDIRTSALTLRSATFIIPIQILLLCLWITIIMIIFSITDFKTKKIIAVCSLVICGGYFVGVYAVSLIR